MSQFPYMKLWVGDFLAKTRNLDAAESGAYLLLLMAAWQSEDCSIPDDDRDLARFARCSRKVWQRVRPRVLAYWKLWPDNRWRNDRLLKEAYLASQVSLTRAAASRGKSLKLNGSPPTNVEQLSIICTHSHSHRSKKEARQEEASEELKKSMRGKGWVS
jgi:uncharacterized protein YdaU (DUF1376 family)